MKMRKKNDTAVYSTGTKVIRFLVVLLMSFVAFLTLYPIFYVVLGAFKKNQELLTGGINIFPSEWIVQNSYSRGSGKYKLPVQFPPR